MYGHANPTIRTTKEGEQVGPKMHSAVSTAEGGPMLGDEDAWPSMNALATTVGPNGSSQFGYRIVKRCIGKGLLTIDPDHDDATPNGRGAVVITEKGERYLEKHE